MQDLTQVLQMCAQLLRLPRAEVRIRVPVLPHERAALVLDEAALRPLHELPHDLKGIGLPTVVRLLHHALHDRDRLGERLKALIRHPSS